ncbi:hypothetical protein [Reichenbachiella sp.]|uniref:hypothetical protein n=1 Tax=Reichenbachiella sp. TaxID=2184521 RepID=UPI003BB11268
MNSISKYLIILFTVIILTRCGAAYKEELVKNHYLIAVDVHQQMSIAYHTPDDRETYITLIGATIYSVGYNEEYIIAKQHPYNIYNSNKSRQTNYFILPVKKTMEWETNNGLIGPMNKLQYLSKKEELGIDGLTFSKTFEHLQ